MNDSTVVRSDSSDVGRERGLQIVKDASFARFAADDIVVITRGSEFELSLIVMGPDPTFRIDLSSDEDEFMEPGPVRLTPSLTEVGRVRIDANTAGNVALNLLERMALSPRFDLEAFRKNVDSIMQRAEAAREKNGQ